LVEFFVIADLSSKVSDSSSVFLFGVLSFQRHEKNEFHSRRSAHGEDCRGFFYVFEKKELRKGRSPVQPRFKLQKKDLRLQNIGGFSINGKGRVK